MKNRPIHENLDTSFVNLSALVRHLRRRQFAGNIRVELGDYEADIVLTAENKLRVRERDHADGRVVEGEEASQRLLIRAREPGGIIHVYQSVEEFAPAFENLEPIAAETEKVEKAVVGMFAKSPHQNGNSKPLKIELPVVEENPPKPNAPPPPFEFRNRVEAKARQSNLAPQDWQTLLNLTAELLSAIDKSLAQANLDFASAFEKARAEITADYPFINPASGIFAYKDGKIIVRQQINAQLFTASINEVLRRIFEKLKRNPKFANVYRIITEKILNLSRERKPLYDKFSITPTLEKIIGAR